MGEFIQSATIARSVVSGRASRLHAEEVSWPLSAPVRACCAPSTSDGRTAALAVASGMPLVVEEPAEVPPSGLDGEATTSATGGADAEERTSVPLFGLRPEAESMVLLSSSNWRHASSEDTFPGSSSGGKPPPPRSALSLIAPPPTPPDPPTRSRRRCS